MPTVAAVLEALLAAPEALVLSKELSFYYDPMAVGEALLGKFVHVFLVRDPQATVESLWRASLRDDENTCVAVPLPRRALGCLGARRDALPSPACVESPFVPRRASRGGSSPPRTLNLD